MNRKLGLSKSRITLFEQCPKRLWMSVYRPELAEQSIASNAVMAAGHEVGAIACALHPGGYMVEAEHGLSSALATTASLIANGWDHPIFEATFAHEDVLIRADVIWPAGEGAWHLAEVKSSTGVRDYHISDVATQLWVMRGAGVPIASAAIRHIDREFVLREERNYAGLFTDQLVNGVVEPLVAERGGVIAGARQTLLGKEPIREIGSHCDKPFSCSFKDYCGRDLPPGPAWPASLLPDSAGKTLARTWAARGVEDLLAIPSDVMPSPKLARVHLATVTGVPWHDHQAIAAETSGWAYPRTFLDFETVQFAIPRWVGTRPFEQVPFQFSAHVLEEDDALTHHAFLSLDGSDPREACVRALAQLPGTGAVIAWNASFERRCLLDLAAAWPEHAGALTSLARRLVDLLPVARRHYYHRDMRGSWSIKAVLPTVAPELDYRALEGVRSGVDAQLAYAEAIAPDTSRERRVEIHAALNRYCQRDTEAMVVLLQRLCSVRA